EHPSLWQAALAVAAGVGGPFVRALERLAEDADTPLPLAELADAIPYGHAALRNLALIAARRTATGPGPANLEDEATRAATLNNLAPRQSKVGGRAAPRATAGQAVQLNRQRAEANPQAFLPDLAASLTNLANRQSEVGDRAAALATAGQAVELYRPLAEA